MRLCRSPGTGPGPRSGQEIVCETVPVRRDQLPRHAGDTFVLRDYKNRLCVHAEGGLEPGDSYSGEAHPAGTHELLYVLTGQLTLTVEDECDLPEPSK